jgi:hypothetical protein
VCADWDRPTAVLMVPARMTVPTTAIRVLMTHLLWIVCRVMPAT